MLAESVGTPYMRYMKSPLLLSMFILTYNEHPELPRHISSFYYNVLILYILNMMRKAKREVTSMRKSLN